MKREAVAAGVVAWARKNGSDTGNVRDAAHEACHALQTKVRHWDREDIHRALLARVGRARMPSSEIEARAVERLVCKAVRVEHDWGSFLFLAFVEAMKSGAPLPADPKALEAAVQRAMKSSPARARSAAILRAGRKQAMSPRRGRRKTCSQKPMRA